MLKIKTASLRSFADHTKYISTNKLLPILGNLHLQFKDGNWLLAKNNIAAVCIRKIEVEGDPVSILLDERILLGFLSATKAEFITVNIDSQITIDDGKTQIQFQAENPDSFPMPSLEDIDDVKTLSRSVLSAIAVAKNFIYEMESAANYQYVHVNGSHISGFHNSYFYVNNQFEDLPVFLLTREEADIICSFETIQHGATERSNYFYTPDTTYIFAKNEYKPPKLESILTRLQLPGKDFTFNKQELVDFMSIANIVTDSPIAGCSMEAAGAFMSLKLSDANFSRATERQVDITGSLDKFAFNSRLLINPIRSVPYEILKSKTNQNCLIITGEQEYFCFIGMQN